MRNDSLRNFIKLRHQLATERETLGARLREINEALGELPLPSLSAISGTPEEMTTEQGVSRRGGKRTMSAAARARIAAAQRARWAASRQSGSKPAPVASGGVASGKPKRKMSAAGRKAIAEAARRRWSEAKALGKSRL